MLASIHPLGERVRGNRWWLTAAAHIAASALAGALAGAGAGSAAHLTLGRLLRGGAGAVLVGGVRPEPGLPGAGERGRRHPRTSLELPAPLPRRRGGRPLGDGGIARRPGRRGLRAGGPAVTALSRFGLTVDLPRGWEGSVFRR